MPDQAVTRLIDVSPHQHRRGAAGPDWAAVRASGVAGVYLRAAEGKDADEHPGGYSFAHHRQAAADAGLLVGAYQYLRARHRGAWQADLLLELLGDTRPGELPPVVDVETLDGRPAVEVQACLIDWVARARAVLGRLPVVYTYPDFWQRELHGAVLSEVADCPLWIAHYGVKEPIVPKPWSRYALWQHSGDGRCPGIEGPCDLNTWPGDEASLRAWASPPQIDRGAVLGLVASTLNASVVEGLDEARRGR